MEFGQQAMRNLIPDASPQHGWEFFIVIEERYTRIPRAEQTSPMHGHIYQRRRLPLATLGYRRTSTAHKLRKLVNMALLESGKSLLLKWRKSVKHLTSDQGTERKLISAPFGMADENLNDVLQKLRDGSLKLSEHVGRQAFFLMNCMEHPESLHILFNAVEEQVTKLPEWEEAEPLIKALSKTLGNSMYKEALLEGSFKDAGSVVRKQIHRYKAEHVDWRWETLEEVTDFLGGILATFLINFKPEDLKESPSLCKQVIKATQCPWLRAFVITIHTFLAAVGSEASRLEGCVCHENLLLQGGSYITRKRRLAEARGDQGPCPWAGKWSVAFALGYCDTMCNRVASATTVRYQEMLATSTPAIRSRMMAILAQVATGFTATVRAKFSFYLHIPHRVAGAFGQYFGYTLEEAKRCTASCFEEWDATENKDTAHRVSFHLFDRSSSVSLQLMDFSSRPGRDLWDYPEAFEEVQEIGLILIERVG